MDDQKNNILASLCLASNLTANSLQKLQTKHMSHLPNISLRCSNQPLRKLNLMTGVNTAKQQTGEIKNAK